MTWVDIVVLSVLAISGLLAFLRGFVREVLGIGAWVGAVVVALWGYPLARPRFEQWLSGSPELVAPVTYATLGLVTLIVLLFVSHHIGNLVRGSVLGGLDRTLGLAYGLVRGAALVVVAYIVVPMVLPMEHWPAPVREALSVPIAYAGAEWTVEHLPDRFRPRVYPPPDGRQTTADALLQALPQGRATGKPVARP